MGQFLEFGLYSPSFHVDFSSKRKSSSFLTPCILGTPNKASRTTASLYHTFPPLTKPFDEYSVNKQGQCPCTPDRFAGGCGRAWGCMDRPPVGRGPPGSLACIECAGLWIDCKGGVARTEDMPRPYNGTGHVWWPCRGAPVCAPVHESGMCAAGRHIGRPLQGKHGCLAF